MDLDLALECHLHLIHVKANQPYVEITKEVGDQALGDYLGHTQP